MKKIDKELIEWAINKIESEFDGDISLLLGRRGACKVPEDGDDMAFDFFIPANDNGYSLSRTFIIDDMGYDLFPMSWKRVEGLSTLNEAIAFCLADSEILYARSDYDRERFELLRKTLFNNLKDEDFIYKKALEKIDAAMDIYKTMLFEKPIGNVRKAAGGILQYLNFAIALMNNTYISGDYGYWGGMEQIKKLAKVPDNYLKNYESILKTGDVNIIISTVHNSIEQSREFVGQFTPKKNKKHYRVGALNGWEEARYTFRRLAYACENNKFVDSFNLGCYLQIEFDILTDEAGLSKMDLMSAYDAENLLAFKKRAEDIEAYIESEISRHEIVYRKYYDLEEFLKMQK